MADVIQAQDLGKSYGEVRALNGISFGVRSGECFGVLGHLPGWVQAADWANPLYHTVTLCRALALGETPPSLWRHIAILAIIGAALLPFPLKLMERRPLS